MAKCRSCGVLLVTVTQRKKGYCTYACSLSESRKPPTIDHDLANRYLQGKLGSGYV